ncbi:hypothetical protein HNP49_002039 [Pseudomonas fluvialis]|uniref:DUF4381 domain-containing protein n=1 Tax=Pseudomonas fluvialis TaxID=1793966 RepID=A0A7X0EUS9_9PSED|nr:DUF4381 domain-containing protein [Pseudomonas fluvialis]MBB6341871.1 hypothetical protein [Pseudomonas fluvialis]
MNPLDQLEPLIAPPAISAWPPAPGWWLLPIVLAALLWGLWRLWQRRPRRQSSSEQKLIDPLRLAALLELERLPTPQAGEPAGPWLQQLNQLLKRLCQSRQHHDPSLTLSGRAWLAYLDSRCPAAGLTRWMVLVEGAYRADVRLDDKAVAGLQQAVGTWIRKHV